MPTLFCNLSCRYCYLGDQTSRTTLKADAGICVSTLTTVLQKLLADDVLPFNVSLHGGEVTTLPPAVLEQLFQVINRHYLDHFDILHALGHRKGTPHLKTNLLNFHTLYDLFVQQRVSVSASIDLPLTLHGRYRVDCQGASTLQRTLDNLRLLARYPHSKKISATLYRQHLQDIPALIDDIWQIHREICFDMNNFNIMFGFGSDLNCRKFEGAVESSLQQATEQEQLALYHALHDAFVGTELEEGLRRNWFDEFKPGYCTNALNCGERFMLLQSDGSVWSCVRGQGVEQLHYGNLLTDPVDAILDQAGRKVRLLHQQQGLDPACRSCAYLQICHTGCPAVKLQNRSGKSYTCALQKAIYRDNPASYPALTTTEQPRAAREYLLAMHPALLADELPEQAAQTTTLIPAELLEERNSLQALIDADPLLLQLYSPDAVVLELDGELFPLASQITKPQRMLHSIGPDSRLTLHLRQSLFTCNCSELIRNTLYLQLLRDTTVVYGDEQRSKQEHLVTHQIFYSLLQHSSRLGEDWLMVDLDALLATCRQWFIKGVLNNLFVTTGQLREYHYQKQKNNAFYHIQAMNLPFQNFEFYWDERA